MNWCTDQASQCCVTITGYWYLQDDTKRCLGSRKILCSLCLIVRQAYLWYDGARLGGGAAMPRMDITGMPFAKLYLLLVTKAEKKGRSRGEVDQVTAWLTGYTPEELARLEQSDVSYGEFFRNAPAMNLNRTLITGKICGIRVEKIEDPLIRDIRYLDKLVDELAKGKAMEEILRK